jgi:hypothetical protein
LRQVLEGWIGHERLKKLLLVEQRVDKVRVVLDHVDETRVDDLEDHAQHFLKDGDVGDGLADGRVVVEA